MVLICWTEIVGRDGKGIQFTKITEVFSKDLSRTTLNFDSDPIDIEIDVGKVMLLKERVFDTFISISPPRNINLQNCSMFNVQILHHKLE